MRELDVGWLWLEGNAGVPFRIEDGGLAGYNVGVVYLEGSKTVYGVSPNGTVYALLRIGQDKKHIVTFEPVGAIPLPLTSGSATVVSVLAKEGERDRIAAIIETTSKDGTTRLSLLSISINDLEKARRADLLRAPKTLFLGVSVVEGKECLLGHDPARNELLGYEPTGVLLFKHPLMTQADYQTYQKTVTDLRELKEHVGKLIGGVRSKKETLGPYEGSLGSLDIIRIEGFSSICHGPRGLLGAYLDVGSGSIVFRTVLRNSIGNLGVLTPKDRCFDYKLLQTKSNIYAFTTEFRETKSKARFWFRAYRYSGGKWKSLADWAAPMEVTDESEVYSSSYLFSPVADNGSVIVYYVPKARHDHLPIIKTKKYQDLQQ